MSGAQRGYFSKILLLIIHSYGTYNTPETFITDVLFYRVLVCNFLL